MTDGRVSKKQLRVIQGEICEYVAYLAPMVGLRDWTFTVSVERGGFGDDQPSSAEVMPIDHRRLAAITVYVWQGATKQDLDSGQFHHVLIHELMHCVMHQQDTMIRHTTCKLVKSQRAYDVFWETYRQHSENTADNMAASFADLIPVPKAITKRIRKAL
jgi:hypothetical protein